VLTLNPQYAATIARGVYRLTDIGISEIAALGYRLGSEELFAVSDRSRFVGESGGLLAFKKISGFGYIAAGKGSYQGEILLATRGTIMTSAADWLTNLHIGLESGPSGRPVHAGFNQVWRSFAPEIREFLRHRNPTVVHCVGHSLGGALAHLNADLLNTLGVGMVKLYTFGAPRCGIANFAGTLTDGLGAEHMYRVHHAADVVPMVPLFPFLHAPTRGRAYLVRNGNTGFVSFAAHGMDSYQNGVAGLDWPGLGALPEPPMSDGQLGRWLDQTAATSGPAIVGSAYALKLINRAIHWILASSGALLANGLSFGFTTAFTLLDHLASLLYRGAQVSAELSEKVSSLIAVIFKFLGHRMVAATSLTLAFIRWVLEMFLTFIASVARKALFLTGK
jgi:triacylglycerol lipase